MFEENRLHNELSVIYSDNNKHLPPHKLLDLIIKNNLQEIYSQFTKLWILVLTIPDTTACSERSMSTLKRIKSFLRNTMTNERFTNLSSLAIEKNLLGVMAKDPTFLESIIDDFAKKKERRIELEYKISILIIFIKLSIIIVKKGFFLSFLCSFFFIIKFSVSPMNLLASRHCKIVFD